MLKHGDLDAVLLALPLQEENVEEFELYTEPFLFAAATEHPKAQQKSVSADDLQDEEVLLLEDGHCLRDQALSGLSCSSRHQKAPASRPPASRPCANWWRLIWA